MNEKELLEAAQQFTIYLSNTDRQLRRSASTVPSKEIKEQVAAEFWRLFTIAEQFQKLNQGSDLQSAKTRFRQIIVPWLCRSRFFWRSIIKPNGFPGDYQIIEWMYDLEHHAGEDPTQPAIINCLDYTFSTIHSVQSVWERRKWFAYLLDQEFQINRKIQIMDVACGGARYIKDFLLMANNPSEVSITLLDQDASAIAYTTSCVLSPWSNQVTAISAPIKAIANILPGQYDVIISAGLFDYLEQQPASMLLNHLVNIAAEKGIVAISNFHPDDASACCKDWGADWQIIFRDEHSIAELFPCDTDVKTSRSKNMALAYAWVRK